MGIFFFLAKGQIGASSEGCFPAGFFWEPCIGILKGLLFNEVLFGEMNIILGLWLDFLGGTKKAWKTL